MRVLAAPDKFKGTLTAREAARAIRRGVERAGRGLGVHVEVDECPIADGGEGTIDVLECVPGASRTEVVCADLLGARRAISILFGASRSFSTDHVCEKPPLSETLSEAADAAAVIESASVIGLHLIPADQRDPESIGTSALAPLLHAARDRGCTRILVGLGGSATVDGGMGLASAMGVEWLDERGEALPAVARSLPDIRGIRCREMLNEWRALSIVALCDVQTPLLGPRGAARLFGPQKGATPQQVERLECGLENLVRACREGGIPCDPDQPGAGAAGGLGFGLATILGARLVPGAACILDLLGFDERAAAAEVILTGEGKMDMQTAEGKACAEAARGAERAGKPCIAVVGTTEGDAEVLRGALAGRGVRFHSIHRLADAAGAPGEEKRSTANALEEAAFRVASALLTQR